MSKPRYDLEVVRAAARGRWRQIISRVCGIRESILTTREGPCPKCGGTGRFNTYKDFDETGGMRCNQCFSSRNGDGFAGIQWISGCTFPESIQRVAEFLGVQPEKVPPGRNGKAKSEPPDPEKDLEFVDWNDMLVATWLKQTPIKPHTLKVVGARMAVYRKQYKVIALPILGEGDKPVGWCMYNVTGGTLPRWDRDGKVVEQLKVKSTSGSKAGVVG